jgi:prepilin-type N-terminal cleavage/methylation domain-containing protein/prepilin-type processing-associated H-X9-DG protein
MRRGFTLIELLVVIAIIAILAAILFPVFARAREKARQSSCLSNVKQLGLAAQMYIQDYDETFPFASIYHHGAPERPWAGGNSVIHYWADSLFPYLKNSQILYCPSRSEWIGYGWNCRIGYYGNRQPPSSYTSDIYRGVKLASIAFPAECPAVGDHHGGDYIDDHNGALYRLWTGGYGNPDYQPPPHNGGVNIAFVDGHGKWFKPMAANDVVDGGTLKWYPDRSEYH